MRNINTPSRTDERHDDLNTVGCRKSLAEMSKASAVSQDVATPTSRTSGLRELRYRSTATRRRDSASPRPRSTTRSTTRSASVSSPTIFTQSNQYRVVLEVKPEFGRGPLALDGIYVSATGVSSTTGQGAQGQSAQKALNTATSTTAAAGSTTNQVPLSSIATVVERPTSLGDQPHRPVPVGHGVVQPGVGRVARRCGEVGPRGDDRPRHAGQSRDQLPGRGARVPGLARQHAAADPRGRRHDVHRARRALRELHPSDHDPLDAAVRGPSGRCCR